MIDNSLYHCNYLFFNIIIQIMNNKLRNKSIEINRSNYDFY